jgi:catechol 2,3-dioxygenase-like lactoylglutathione lyase family enzyme
MSIEKLDHYSIRTAQVQRAIDFYGQALGFATGPRPPFPFSGAWLYATAPEGEITGGAVVHLVGVDPANPAGLGDYLGDKAGPAGSDSGTGAIDHIAFAASDIAETYARLAQYQIAFRQRKVPSMELHQIFIEDPDGVTIELNYARPDDIAVGQRNALQQQAK